MNLFQKAWLNFKAKRSISSKQVDPSSSQQHLIEVDFFTGIISLYNLIARDLHRLDLEEVVPKVVARRRRADRKTREQGVVGGQGFLYIILGEFIREDSIWRVWKVGITGNCLGIIFDYVRRFNCVHCITREEPAELQRIWKESEVANICAAIVTVKSRNCRICTQLSALESFFLSLSSTFAE